MPKIDIVANAGTTIGTVIRLKIRNSFAPSMRVASVRSFGYTDSRYCFRKNTVDGAAIDGTISGM